MKSRLVLVAVALLATSILAAQRQERYQPKPLPSGKAAITRAVGARQDAEWHRKLWIDAYRKHRSADAPKVEQVEALLGEFAALGQHGRESLSTKDEQKWLARARALQEAGVKDSLLALVIAMLGGAGVDDVTTSLDKQGYPAVFRFLGARAFADRALLRGAPTEAHDKSAARALARAAGDPVFRGLGARHWVELLDSHWPLDQLPESLLPMLESVKGVDPWIMAIAAGSEKLRAGIEQAESFPAPKHLSAAIEKLEQAQKLREVWPHAAARLTLAAGLAARNPYAARRWFDVAVAREFDHPHAYGALLEAWEYRSEIEAPHLLSFGAECVASGRFDTDVPDVYVRIVESLGGELTRQPFVFRLPQVFATFERFVEGVVATPSRVDEHVFWRSALTLAAFAAGRRKQAVAELTKLNTSFDFAAFDLIQLDREKTLVYLTKKAGLSKEKIETANASREPGSFRWAVKSPDDFHRMFAEAMREREALKSKSIPELVKILANPETTEEAARRLEELGAKAVPALLEGIRAKRFAAKGKSSSWGSPLCRAVRVVGQHGDKRALPVLLPLLKRDESHVREFAIEAIAAIGAPGSIEPVLAALDDRKLRSDATDGIRYAANNGRASREFRTAIAKKLAEIVPTYVFAAEAYLALDRESAVRLLTSPPILRLETENLGSLIYRLNYAGVALPCDRLVSFLPKLEAKILVANSRDDARTYGEILDALARAKDPRTPQLCEKTASWDHWLAADALSALCDYHRVDPIGYLFPIWKEVGVAGMTEAQRAVWTVHYFDAEVCNGGLHQYFFNSSGDDARTALAALELFGADKSHRILKDAMALFGSKGPSADRDRRMEQLSSFDDARDKKLDELTSSYYSNKATAKMYRFVLNNLDEFRSRK